MRKHGLNEQFLRDISERVSKLKQNPTLLGESIIADIDSNLKLLTNIHQDSNSGVPPPPADTSNDYFDSLKNSKRRKDQEESLDIDKIREMNGELKINVLRKLEKFKMAKHELRKLAKQNPIEDSVKLSSCENNSSSDHKIKELYTMLQAKELENRDLKVRISEIEEYLLRHSKNYQEICRCSVF